MALLRSRSPRPQPEDDKNSAPEDILREASILHPYAVAAYTVSLSFRVYMLLNVGTTWLVANYKIQSLYYQI